MSNWAVKQHLDDHVGAQRETNVFNNDYNDNEHNNDNNDNNNGNHNSMRLCYYRVYSLSAHSPRGRAAARANYMLLYVIGI